MDDIDGIVCVADDVLVYGVGDTTKDAMKDHQKLTLLLQRCTKHRIKLNKAKSIFCCTEVPFLGHLITSEGLKPDPGKIDAILKMQQPTTVQEVQRLCELSGTFLTTVIISYATSDETNQEGATMDLGARTSEGIL